MSRRTWILSGRGSVLIACSPSSSRVISSDTHELSDSPLVSMFAQLQQPVQFELLCIVSSSCLLPLLGCPVA
ncbi:hypothetical protein BT69DRAFT_676878 [Atractiella rhizophila]|nr:hypothetical protein BT69DRAFT_676878 [Atractiella rhizophila]